MHIAILSRVLKVFQTNIHITIYFIRDETISYCWRVFSRFTLESLKSDTKYPDTTPPTAHNHHPLSLFLGNHQTEVETIITIYYDKIRL